MLTRTLPAFAVVAAVGAAALSGVVWFVLFGGVSSATPFAPASPPLEAPAEAERAPAIELEASKQRTAATVTIDVAVTPAGTPDVAAEVAPGEAATAETSELLELRREVARLRARVEWLEVELDLCGSEVTKGPVARWLANVAEADRPTLAERRTMAEILAGYPVELTTSEGLWVLERIRAKDWKTYGPTIDEALILFLGPARLMRELDPVRADALRAEWTGEGYFD